MEKKNKVSFKALKDTFDYKWVILFLCFLMNFVCLGFCSSNKGLYLTAITEALGIERSLFSVNDSCRFIATAVINLFFGSLITRFGFRKMAAFGFLCLIGSMVTYIFAENIFVFYIGGTLLGFGLSFTTTTMTSSLIRRWFTKDIGKYTGLVFASNGIGGALAAQIITPIIYQEGNPFGYRDSYTFVVISVAIVGILVVSLLRESPKNASINQASVQKKKARGTVWAGIDFKVAKLRPYFYLCAFSIFLTGFILQSINGVYAAHMRDMGMGKEMLATVSSVYALALTFSKVFVGWVYDRFGLKVILYMCHGSTVLAFIALLMITSITPSTFIIAIAFAITYAIALPLETLVIPLIVNDIFGSASHDKILGIMAAMNYTGYALGTPLVNMCYDVFGTYRPVFISFAILMPVVDIIFHFIIKSSNKDKAVIMAGETAN